MSEFQYLDQDTSEAQNRLATSFLFSQSSPGLARTGVLSGLAVTQTGSASNAVLAAPGAGPVQASVLAGMALLVNDTSKTLDVLTANPVGGLPRNDIIAFNSVTKATHVIVGTPNASPTDPTVPTTEIPLARLRHAASATTIPTAVIDDLRVPARLFGVRDPAVSRKGTTDIAAIAASEVAIANLPAIVADGVKEYRVSGGFYSLAGTVPGDVFEVRVKNATSGAVLTVSRVTIPAAPYLSNGVSVSVTNVPVAGSVAYQIAVVRVSGTGTGTVLATATSPREIVVEHIA